MIHLVGQVLFLVGVALVIILLAVACHLCPDDQVPVVDLAVVVEVSFLLCIGLDFAPEAEDHIHVELVHGAVVIQVSRAWGAAVFDEYVSSSVAPWSGDLLKRVAFEFASLDLDHGFFGYIDGATGEVSLVPVEAIVRQVVSSRSVEGESFPVVDVDRTTVATWAFERAAAPDGLIVFKVASTDDESIEIDCRDGAATDLIRLDLAG